MKIKRRESDMSTEEKKIDEGMRGCRSGRAVRIAAE